MKKKYEVKQEQNNNYMSDFTRKTRTLILTEIILKYLNISRGFIRIKHCKTNNSQRKVLSLDEESRNQYKISSNYLTS